LIQLKKVVTKHDRNNKITHARGADLLRDELFIDPHHLTRIIPAEGSYDFETNPPWQAIYQGGFL
jgi:hypothetical protein